VALTCAPPLLCGTTQASKKLTKTMGKYYRVLVSVFYFYCAQDGNPECHHMQGSEWMKFLTDAQIPNDKSAQCKVTLTCTDRSLTRSP
jgi:hypothetical protein